LQNIAVIRLIDSRLAWYPPGASEEPQWLDNDIARETLRSAVTQRRVSPRFAVPGSDVRLLTLPVPAAERKHISKSLPFTLEEQVAEDIDDLHFAYMALDRETYAVAVCSRERMAAWQELLAELPGVNQWHPEPLLLPLRKGEWCMVLEEGRAIIRLGDCEGFSVERELVPVMLQGALDEDGEPAAVIIYGSDQAADTALVPEALRERVQWRAGNLYSAMLLSDGGQLHLNLMQGDFAPRLPLGRWWRQWRAVAGVFAGAFLLQLAATYAEYRSLNAQNEALRGAVQASYRKAFPRGAVVDAEKQLRRQLEALRGTGQTSGFVSLMERVGGAVAGMPGTSIATINYNDKGDSMRLNIVAADFEGVEQLRSRINEAGLDAVMESSNAQGDRVRARLRVEERS
jgi:type II secretion system protein L